MFRRLNGGTGDAVTVTFEGQPLMCRATDTVAAAILLANTEFTRRTPVNSTPRLPYCHMGVCFECLMEIDGIPNQQACMIRVRDGMRIKRQFGIRDLPGEG